MQFMWWDTGEQSIQHATPEVSFSILSPRQIKLNIYQHATDSAKFSCIFQNSVVWTVDRIKFCKLRKIVGSSNMNLIATSNISILPWGFVVSELLAMFFSLMAVQVKTVTECFATACILAHNSFWCHCSPPWIRQATEYRPSHIHCRPWLAINITLLNKQYLCSYNLKTGHCNNSERSKYINLSSSYHSIITSVCCYSR